MSIELTYDPSGTNKSFRALYAAVQGNMAYVSGSVPSDISFKEDIIEDSYTGENNTVGTNETLFHQFHAYVSGGILWNDTSDSTQAGPWTHSLNSGESFYYHYLSMSMFTPSDVGTFGSTRYHSHLNRPQWFEWDQPFFQFTSGSSYATTLPYLTPSSSMNMHTYRNPNLGGITNDIGYARCRWSDPFNYFNDIPNCAGGGCYTVNDGRITQATVFTVYKASGGGGAG
tara:strand:- start:724 stop:1407 length:684 start_codon:yes stop_codon:yes gene_type:complete